MNWRWFNWSSPMIGLGQSGRRAYVRLWNLFNRCSADGHWWGLGILQIGNRHLFCVAHSGVSILFIGKTG
jgi:hypothetical protein